MNYAHALLTEDALAAGHLDTALVHFTSEEEVIALFKSGVKKKGTVYEKYFRVDTEVPINLAVSLVGSFFPVDELTGEYFEHAHAWPELWDDQAPHSSPDR